VLIAAATARGTQRPSQRAQPSDAAPALSLAARARKQSRTARAAAAVAAESVYTRSLIGLGV
jgi:hypothetical protein